MSVQKVQVARGGVEGELTLTLGEAKSSRKSPKACLQVLNALISTPACPFVLTPPAFENLCGKATNAKWKQSLKLVDAPQQSIGKLMANLEVEGPTSHQAAVCRDRLTKEVYSMTEQEAITRAATMVNTPPVPGCYLAVRASFLSHGLMGPVTTGEHDSASSPSMTVVQLLNIAAQGVWSVVTLDKHQAYHLDIPVPPDLSTTPGAVLYVLTPPYEHRFTPCSTPGSPTPTRHYPPAAVEAITPRIKQEAAHQRAQPGRSPLQDSVDVQLQGACPGEALQMEAVAALASMQVDEQAASRWQGRRSLRARTPRDVRMLLDTPQEASQALVRGDEADRLSCDTASTRGASKLKRLACIAADMLGVPSKRHAAAPDHHEEVQSRAALAAVPRSQDEAAAGTAQTSSLPGNTTSPCAEADSRGEAGQAAASGSQTEAETEHADGSAGRVAVHLQPQHSMALQELLMRHQLQTLLTGHVATSDGVPTGCDEPHASRADHEQQDALAADGLRLSQASPRPPALAPLQQMVFLQVAAQQACVEQLARLVVVHQARISALERQVAERDQRLATLNQQACNDGAPTYSPVPGSSPSRPCEAGSLTPTQHASASLCASGATAHVDAESAGAEQLPVSAHTAQLSPDSSLKADVDKLVSHHHDEAGRQLAPGAAARCVALEADLEDTQRELGVQRQLAAHLATLNAQLLVRCERLRAERDRSLAVIA